jgi:hypothetical protein
MARFWPNAPADDPFAAYLNPITKYVASRTLRDEDLTWQNSHLIKGHLATEVRKLKESPIVIGSGKKLFRDAETRALRLVDSKPTPTCCVILTYEPIR